jgi:hypothetical protein
MLLCTSTSMVQKVYFYLQNGIALEFFCDIVFFWSIISTRKFLALAARPLEAKDLMGH